MHYTHAISFGDFLGYTSIPWAHYCSLESSRVDLAPKKIQFDKKSILNQKNLFLDPRPGSKSPLPRCRNQDWPQGLKVSATLLLVHSGHKTCAGQIIEQVLLIDTVVRKGGNGRVDRLSQIWLCCAGAWPNRVLQQFCYFYLIHLTPKVSLTNRNSIVHLHSIHF